MKLRHALVALVLLAAQDAPAVVERPAPGKAPTAFRIWRAGENVADEGSVFFTEESAKALLAEQESRARVYSIDFDHLSLKSSRPAEAGRAAGWHRLEVRTDADGKPELWAVDVEWCEDVRAGLEESPPRWRFFSPAFTVDKRGEITSYVNLALCINPMTHGIPVLAAAATDNPARGGDMDPKKCAALLAAMADSEQDEDKKAALLAAAAAFGEEKEGDSSDKKDEEKKEAAEDDSSDKKDDEEKSEEAAKKHAAAALAAENVTLTKRLDRLEVNALIEKRKDLSEAVKAWCLAEEPEVVRRFLGKVDKVHAIERKERPTQGDRSGMPALLEGKEREELDKAMGLRTHAVKPYEKLPDGRFVLNISARPESAQKGQG